MPRSRNSVPRTGDGWSDDSSATPQASSKPSPKAVPQAFPQAAAHAGPQVTGLQESALLAAQGRPAHDRRLSDKILAAFTCAYGGGSLRTAERLRAVLADVEQEERRRHDRRGQSALDQADHWVRFIKARDAYSVLAEDDAASPADREAALNMMRQAYRAWSQF